jgi:DNA polymerase (family 10)
MGIKLAIGTDAHAINQLRTMRLGIAVARRGWLSRGDVINTLGVEELFKSLRK